MSTKSLRRWLNSVLNRSMHIDAASVTRPRFTRPALETLECRITPTAPSVLNMYNDLNQPQYTGNRQNFIDEYKADLFKDILRPMVQDFDQINPFQPVENFLTQPMPGLSSILAAVGSGQYATPKNFLPRLLFSFVIGPDSILDPSITIPTLKSEGFSTTPLGLHGYT